MKKDSEGGSEFKQGTEKGRKGGIDGWREEGRRKSEEAGGRALVAQWFTRLSLNQEVLGSRPEVDTGGALVV